MNGFADLVRHQRTSLKFWNCLTYVSLLQHVGVIDTLAQQAVALGAPLLIALVLCYVIGVGSAFASSTALLTAFIPLAGPLLASSSLSASGTVAALAIAATVVDVSPFSSDGALVVANARENDRQHVYKQLMIYAGGVTLSVNGHRNANAVGCYLPCSWRAAM